MELERRDQEDEYLTDDREGADVTDSDEEFEAIVEIDKIKNELE